MKAVSLKLDKWDCLSLPLCVCVLTLLASLVVNWYLPDCESFVVQTTKDVEDQTFKESAPTQSK